MIHVESLTKRYGRIDAIRDVSFQVPEGRILGFLGPNGAGKTTTMRILTGYLPATSGTARCAGFDVFTQSLDVRRRIGYLPEGNPLYREMRVREFLRFVATVKGAARPQRRAHVAEAIKAAALTDVADRIIGTLSRGYQQRVGLAQALIGDPPVLILDEPTVGLDPKQIVEIRQLIASFRGRRTVILSTHILPEVSAVCDDVAIIDRGRIVAQDSLEHLTAPERAFGRLRLQAVGTATDIESAVRAVPGVTAVDLAGQTEGPGQAWDIRVAEGADARAAIAQAIVAGGWQLLELHAVRISLEDIFLQTLTDAPVDRGAESLAEEVA